MMIVSTTHNPMAHKGNSTRAHMPPWLPCRTVDDYQGQEERIVFISTTLSRPESLPPLTSAAAAAAAKAAPASAASTAASCQQQQAQQELGLSASADVGFWRSPRRFCVAITRAKALLVVIGQPAVLLEDGSWRELLR